MVNYRRWRYVPQEKRLAETLKAADRAARDAQAPTGTEREQAVRVLKQEVDFLINQVSYAAGPTVPRSRTADPAVTDPDYVWEPFSAAEDVLLEITAPESGAVVVEVSAYCRAEVGGRISSVDSVSVSAQALLGFEVLRPDNSVFVAADSSRAANVFAKAAVWLNSPARVATGAASFSRVPVSGLTPGVKYAFRSRMGSIFSRNVASYDFSFQSAIINSPRISITNIR